MEEKNPAQGTSLRSEVSRLLRGSMIYAVPPMLGRALSFLLVPIYTQVMDPAEFGAASLGLALAPAIALVMTFGVHLSINRLHHHFDGDARRREFYGTVLCFMVLAPGLITLVLHGMGAFGYLELFDALPFETRLVLVLWMAYFMAFGNVPVTMYAVREEPVRSALFATLSPVLMAVFGVLLVVVAKRGATGYIEAGLWSAAIPAVLGMIVGFRLYPPRFSTTALREALAFGVPLVPHLASQWALSLADRVVLEAFTTREVLGVYSLAYSFAMLVPIAAMAIDRAFVPMLNRKLSSADGSDVPRLGTLSLSIKLWIALGVALLAPDVVRLVTPAEYHDAADYIPLLVLGMVIQSFGQLWVQGIFFARKTRHVPIATIAAALLSLTLNLLLVPLIGAWAAALAAVLGYAVQTALYAWFARSAHRIDWEYRRWVMLFLCTLALYAAWQIVPSDWSIGVRLGLAAILGFFGFPMVVVLSGTVEVRGSKR